MGIELGQLIGQDVFCGLDVGEVPADEVGNQVVGVPGAEEDLTALFRRQRRKFSQDVISGLLQAVKELGLANIGGELHEDPHTMLR